MFEISDLKAKKLPELQEIAKDLKVPKFKTMKKLDLVYQILDLQATNPKVVVENTNPPEETPGPRPRKERAPRPIKEESKNPESGAVEKVRETAPRERKEAVKGRPPRKDNKPNVPQKQTTPNRRPIPAQTNQPPQTQPSQPQQPQPQQQQQQQKQQQPNQAHTTTNNAPLDTK